ncbi:MAG: hypothetical protein Q8Q59_15870 [Luteolibacter sp.]|nr:hypothetical protein [Luteolibacter sp.]
MKTRLIIGWMVAAVVYVLTIAIAVDQIGNRNERIAEMEAKVKRAEAVKKEALALAKETIALSEKGHEEMMPLLLETRRKAQEAMTLTKVARDLEEAMSRHRAATDAEK